MPIALADLQNSLLGACQNQINFVLANPSTGAPPGQAIVSAFLNWPIADAIQQCGGTIVAIGNVTDQDCATVPDAILPRFMALALLQAKRRIRGQMAFVDQKTGKASQSLSDLAKQLGREIDDLQEDVERRFGIRPTAAAITPMTSAGDVGAGGLWPFTNRPPSPYGGFEFP
jgi:hypothetical protein